MRHRQNLECRRGGPIPLACPGYYAAPPGQTACGWLGASGDDVVGVGAVGEVALGLEGGQAVAPGGGECLVGVAAEGEPFGGGGDVDRVDDGLGHFGGVADDGFADELGVDVAVE